MTKTLFTTETLVAASFVPNTNFDYSFLSADKQSSILQWRDEVRDELCAHNFSKMKIGQKLCSIRECLGYGQFVSWLEAEFPWCVTQAYNYMNVFEAFGSFPNFEKLQLSDSALYLLATRSTPLEAREEVLALAVQGEVFSYSRVREIVRRYKASSKLKSAEQVKDDVLVETDKSSTTSSAFNNLGESSFSNVVSLEEEQIVKEPEPEEMELHAPSDEDAASLQFLSSQDQETRALITTNKQGFLAKQDTVVGTWQEISSAQAMVEEGDRDCPNYSSSIYVSEKRNTSDFIDTLSTQIDTDFLEFMADEDLDLFITRLESLCLEAKEVKKRRYTNLSAQ